MKSRIVLVIMLICLSCNRVSANDSIKNKVSVERTKESFCLIDSVARRELKDLSSAILDCDSMFVEVTAKENEELPRKELNNWMRNLVKYTICQPSMYRTNKKVYAYFYANATIVVPMANNDSILIEFDYSMYKWRVKDNQGNVVCKYDLPNTDLLSMIYMLYPESKMINIKYNRYIKGDEE